MALVILLHGLLRAVLLSVREVPLPIAEGATSCRMRADTLASSMDLQSAALTSRYASTARRPHQPRTLLRWSGRGPQFAFACRLEFHVGAVHARASCGQCLDALQYVGGCAVYCGDRGDVRPRGLHSSHATPEGALMQSMWPATCARQRNGP
jgi:hypothetical protein